MLKYWRSMADVPICTEKWNAITTRLPQLEILLEVKQIEAEIASDPARLVTDEELERQIAEKVALNVAH